MALRALLFDFDGVVADTENVHIAAWQRTFADLGWEVADEMCARAAEEDDRSFLASIFAAKKIEGGNIEGWVGRKQALTIAMLSDAPRLYPGVAALVQELRGELRLAVVTGTWRANVEAVLRGSGLADAFEVIVAKEDTSTSKPAPDGYRLALARLELSPAEAVALEDSPTGLAAARAAGLATLAVGHRRSAGEWVGDSAFIAALARPAKVLEILRQFPRSEA